jgi:hypothetical protein
MQKNKFLQPDDLQLIPVEIRKEVMKNILFGKMENDINLETVLPSQETVPPSQSIESFISAYWIGFLALIVSLIGVVLGVSGFSMAASKKKKSISSLMNEIDDTFASFKWKSKRCEAELYRLHDLVDDKLKGGKIDEASYQVLTNRIDKYLTEIKELDMRGPQAPPVGEA